MAYQDEAKAVLDMFLARLFQEERREFLLLANQWGSIQDELDRMIYKLAILGAKSEDQLFREALYQRFLDESKDYIEQYSQIAAGVIADTQAIYGRAGLESAQQMIGLRVGLFNALPVEVINNFIGKSYYDGAKLDTTLFARSYPDTMRRVKDRLLEGVALGRSPRETARLIRKEDTNIPLWQSLRLARTEQMQIFRETSLMQMERSGVVSGWERIEQDDACDFCQAENGKRYSFNEEGEWHPNCRGARIPVIQ